MVLFMGSEMRSLLVGLGSFFVLFVIFRAAIGWLYSRPYFKDYSRREIKDIEKALRRNMPK